MYSLQRRRERYGIIYVWSILEGIVPNFNHIDNNNREVGGILNLKILVMAINVSSIQLKGVDTGKLFVKVWLSKVQNFLTINILPKHLRNTTDCTELQFKAALDQFLKTFPDEPNINGIKETRLVESNIIYDQIIRIGLNKLDGSRSPKLYQVSIIAD